METNNSISDNHLKNITLRNYKSEVNDYSLSIYRNWFCKQSFKNKKVFRIINNAKNSLGNVKDISTLDFSNLCKTLQNSEEIILKSSNNNLFKEVLNNNNIYEYLKSKNCQERLFPMESMLIFKNIDKEKQQNKIEDKINKLIYKIKKYEC